MKWRKLQTMSKLKKKIYVVYDRPLDAPDYYVVRRHLITIEGSIPDPDPFVAFSNDLAFLRHALLSAGFSLLPRHQDDDPVIIETWL